MGTNYYWIEPPCPSPCEHCQQDRVHIGKSSCGWCFALYVDDNRHSLADWAACFRKPGSRIEDEYGRIVTIDEMMKVITKRGSNLDQSKPPAYFYSSWDEFHQRNDSEPGPNGLVRARVDGKHCIGHGEGTWDYITGWFS